MMEPRGSIIGCRGMVAAMAQPNDADPPYLFDQFQHLLERVHGARRGPATEAANDALLVANTRLLEFVIDHGHQLARPMQREELRRNRRGPGPLEELSVPETGFDLHARLDAFIRRLDETQPDGESGQRMSIKFNAWRDSTTYAGMDPYADGLAQYTVDVTLKETF